MTKQSLILHSVAKWFDEIVSGNKTIEGRLMMQVEVGDTIHFVCANKHIDKRVTSVTVYSCFAEMLDVEGIEKILPGVDSMTDAVQIFKDFYPMIIQKKKQVVAIGLC